jgi:hypothetical protein
MLGMTACSSFSGSAVSLSELTKISLDAAIQLDRLLRGTTSDDTPLRQLSDTLRSASNLPRGGSVSSLHYSPTAVGVLSRALEESATGPLSTIDDLTNEVRHYVKMFSEDPGSWDKDTIKRSLAFCLSLHRELVAEISQSELIVPSDDWTGGTAWIS